MKKILTVLSPIDTPWPAMKIATQVAKNHVAEIHLAFLSLPGNDLDYNYPFPNDLSSAEDFPDGKIISESNMQLIEDKLDLFKNECASANISLSFEKSISVNQLIDKTSTADLLVADGSADYLSQILPDLHCPVFIAADDHLPEKAVLMFNNSDSSRFAIDKYIALLPEFKDLPTSLLSINPGDKDENKIFLENVKSSFTDISSKSLDGNAGQVTEDFLTALNGHILVVMGAFGRSAVSRFFHKSLAESVMKEKNVSLFIAHK